MEKARTWLADKSLAYQRGDARLGGWIFALGVLATLGFAPFFIWPLYLLSVALLFALVNHARNRRQACGAALVWGLGHQLTALYWLPRSFYLDAGSDWVTGLVGGVPALLAVAFYGALGVVLVAVVTRSVPRRARPWVFVAAWVLLDVVKSTTPYGFPWLPAGAVWAGDFLGQPVMLQLASLGGVFLLSALVLSVAVLLGLGGKRKAWLAAGILAAVAVFGVVRLAGAPALGAASGPLVRLVQPNVQSALKWDPVQRAFYLEQTLNAAFENPSVIVPDAVVLPETAVAFFLAHDADLRGYIAKKMLPQMTLLTGTVRRDEVLRPDGQPGMPRFGNSLAAMDASGTILASTDKHMLVPFGEFIPLRWLLDDLPLPAPVRTLSQSRLDFTPGDSEPRLATPVGTVAALICYEGIFPFYVARHSANTAWLVNITNDNWFTGTTALFQHAALVRLRSVETGRPVVRVANTGLTLAWDGYGRELGRLPINTIARTDLRLPAPLAHATSFSRLIQALLPPANRP